MHLGTSLYNQSNKFVINFKKRLLPYVSVLISLQHS